MSAPNYTQADVTRICDEADEWAAYAKSNKPWDDMDDVTRLRIAKHLDELCALARQAGGI